MSSSSFSPADNDNDDGGEYKNERSKKGHRNDKVEHEKGLKNRSRRNSTGEAGKRNGGSDPSSSSNFKNQHSDKHKRMKKSETKNNSENRKSSKEKKMKHETSSRSSSYDKDSNKKRKKDKETLHKLRNDKNEDALPRNKGRRIPPPPRRKKHCSDSDQCEGKNSPRRRRTRHRNSKGRKSISRSSCLDEKRAAKSHLRRGSRISRGSSYGDTSSDKSDQSDTSSDERDTSGTSPDEGYTSSSPSDESSVSSGSSKKKGIETEEVEETKPPKEDAPSAVNGKEQFDAHIYDSKEMIRLTISILQNYNFLNNLKILYQKLDKKKKISLEGMKDLKLKKKLRHLFRSWKLEKEGEFYRKPFNFKESIFGIFNSLMYYFLSRLDINKLRRNINKRKARSLKRDDPKQHDDQVGGVNSSRDDYDIDNINYYDSNFIVNFQEEDYPHVMQNTKEQMKSLRELHEEGFFTNTKEQYKEFLEKHKKIDLWGKNEQEQKFLLNSKNSVNERRVFDRGTDLAINRFVKKEDYRKLIKRTKQHVDDKFHKTGDRV
ncbi:hypothetical protein C922_00605 [Plasmodium inui San Antonio 1]|uniref:Uncharacterized protein n=1 Tax=Plasmodium inui San Antonio 1 TaxID=1237626 RepID=W7A711_9APIC|nr:hypothetical protein C922_00605 [Plasmodium inui San Antonio 1]EUD68917.1 hypothetical protein C922_00605 [Plasmodium inui San Antonio 1]